LRSRFAVCALLLYGCAARVDTSWNTENGYRWRALDVPRRGSPGFDLIDSSRSGVAFVNTVSDSLLLQNRILAQGAGVCLGDVDGDGRPDIFLARTEGSSALYRNAGKLRFEDITTRANVAATGRHSSGCAFADVNGDGHLDLLLVAIGGPNALFLNDGTGRFSEQSAEVGLASTAGSTTVAVADVNGDGWLDLYVTNYKAYTMLDRMSPLERSFDQVVQQTASRKFEVRERYRQEYKLVERPDLGGVSLVQRADPDFFYLNDGAGRFVRQPIAGNPHFLDERGRPLRDEQEHFGLAGMFADLDGDGAPDLYVANDFEDPDQFWRNDGRGNFRQVPWQAIRSTSNSGMAVDVGDINRDGLPDFFQVDMLSRDTRRLKTQVATHTAVPKIPGLAEVPTQMQRNTLQLNRGDGTYAEIARYAGVGASGWSWSTVFLDVDLDGWEDILIGAGHRWDVMDGDTQYRLRNRMQQMDWRRMLFEYPPLPLPNIAFRNRGDLTFEDASQTWRFDVGPNIAHGMALADLDGDGDRDVVINRLGSPAAVLRNDATAPRIAIRLKGDAPNTAGIGSRVRVRGGAVPLQEREVIAGGLYLSSSDPELSFATGRADSVSIEVEWRDGRRTVIAGARPNRMYEIEQRAASPRPAPTVASRDSAMFEDVSTMLNGHAHADPPFDDFSRQLLLPNTFSQLGPGVSWYDVDGNGREDLLIGAGRSGSLALFRNDAGRLRPATTRFPPAHLDLTTILGWPDGKGGSSVIAGVSSYEMPSMQNALSVPGLVQYSATSGVMTPVVGGDTASVGPVAMADYDGDGNLDVFVGGRIVPRGYPRAPSSRLFRNEGGRLAKDVENSRLFAGLGMVSAALFSDIDGNGWPDLVLAIEWGGIRVFRNERGHFSAWLDSAGIAGLTSRWNGLATGDLDGDGRLDIVATSWGRNTELSASAERPLYLFPFFTPRGIDALLAQEDPRIHGIAPLTNFVRLGLSLPSLGMRVRSFSAYADAPIEMVLGPRAAQGPRFAVTTLDHTMFLNRGDRFEARPLPMEAQLAPALYAGIADFNGDGNEDLFLSQNYFATEVATPRYDAGRGLLLLGAGNGSLNAVAGQRSGLRIYGEQRGAAYADFDGDGRLDLAVSQNAGPTKLFRNTGATPGLRVRLVGPAGNPTGVGAQLRLRYQGKVGPIREIQAGSGYWSQNGAIQVLGRSGMPSELLVRWPGRNEQAVPLSPGQTELTVTYR
jgi:enediyne biosynthesis protein E4